MSEDESEGFWNRLLDHDDFLWIVIVVVIGIVACVKAIAE